MSCPRCRSTSYQVAAPGVARCNGFIAVATGRHPSGVHGPTDDFMPCGTEYQIPNPYGTPAYCACGMQAVARCTDCSTDLCLDHRQVLGGRVLCAVHAAEMRSTAAEATNHALEERLYRLRELRSKITPEVVARTGDLVVEHRIMRPSQYSGDSQFNYGTEQPGIDYLTPEQLSALEVGQPCPKHGVACRVIVIHVAGRRFRKRTTGATYQMPVWLVPPLGIGVAGSGHIVSTFRVTSAQKSVFKNVLLSDLARVESYSPESRVTRTPLPDILDLVIERIERGIASS